MSLMLRQFIRRLPHVQMIQKAHTNSQVGTTKNILKVRPLLFQFLQAGTLMGAGDFIAQACFEKTPLNQIDYLRTTKFFCLGLFVVGPTVRGWYGFLAHRITNKSATIRTLQKVAIDQFIFAPIFLAQLISIISFMQHQDVGKIKEKLSNEYLDVLIANYYVWPWVQLVNFRFVPLHYQVLLTQAVAVMWNIYISWKTNLSEKSATLVVPSIE